MEQILKIYFGIKASVKEIDAPSVLPFYMILNRTFFDVELSGIHFLLIKLPQQDSFGAPALEKQLAKYIESSGMNAAFLIPEMTKVQRDALCIRKIPFLSLPDQIFLPFLGICLGNHFKKQILIHAERFTPASQCLYLYFLYHSDISSLPKNKAAEVLRLTATSITRASRQLAAIGLITEESSGTEVRMSPADTGKAYYELGKPYLITPVSKVISAAACDALSELPAAGESALSIHSMLNDPDIPVAAIWKNNPVLSGIREVNEKWTSESSLIHLEVWKYDPCLFARNGMIDPVSMAASLAKEENERVQGELLAFMEGIQW